MATIAKITQAFDDGDDVQHHPGSVEYASRLYAPMRVSGHCYKNPNSGRDRSENPFHPLSSNGSSSLSSPSGSTATALMAPSSASGSNESSHPKSPLHGLNLFKGLTNDKKTKDGQAPKRRGPKPDSKPALTRRQELNRQAQRTHRERKEIYIKALESEVRRLKELYADLAQERDNFADENRKLRELLTAHGLSNLLDGLPLIHAGRAPPSSSGSISGSYPAPSSASCRSPGPNTYGSSSALPTAENPNGTGRANGRIDYDQVGIDFVLALERPCMDHMQMLCVKSQESEADISGHALMATCPPESHLIDHPDIQYPHKMPDMQTGDLMKLLDLSNRLPLDGEITPIMAWALLLKDARAAHLTYHDFKAIETALLTKVRCYGFGAVLEEFEVMDALENMFAAKMDLEDSE